MNRLRIVFLTCVMLMPDAAIAQAALTGSSIAQNGNAHGAPACVACHGANGEGMAAAGFPRLAALGATYLAAQLNEFADGQRVSDIMKPIAAALTPDERVLVAKYYASLAVPRTAAQAATSTDSNGARLASEGRWSQGLPACTQCHGRGGDGVGVAFPPLAGQPAAYLESQLREWKAGTRAPGPLGLMKVIADKLSDADITAVAGYFAALPSKGKTP
jgi:cytochrome c553